VRLVDQPTFCHWGASALALPLFVAGVLLLLGVRTLGGSSPEAPAVLSAARSVALAAYGGALPFAAWGLWGIWWRLSVRRVQIPVAGLPPQFDGYRIVQLSDLHIGSFHTAATGRRWTDAARQAEPDLCVLTGDLLTSGAAFHADAAEVVASLSAPDGIFVSLGNHDQAENEVFSDRLRATGAQVLRNEWRCIRRGGADLVVAGVDDRYSGRDDLERTLAGRPAGVPTVLLVHDPAVATEAAGRGVALALSGHTHGGQLGLPGLSQLVNLSVLSGQPRSGLRRVSGMWHFTSSGLGTTGPPLRLGVTPEIAVLVLRCDGCNIPPTQ
jgi:predicted MPP superfamily phosphohydrolase